MCHAAAAPQIYADRTLGRSLSVQTVADGYRSPAQWLRRPAVAAMGAPSGPTLNSRQMRTGSPRGAASQTPTRCWRRRAPVHVDVLQSCTLASWLLPRSAALMSTCAGSLAVLRATVSYGASLATLVRRGLADTGTADPQACCCHDCHSGRASLSCCFRRAQHEASCRRTWRLP